METSRYYNQECVYRSDVEQIVRNYDMVAGNYLKRVSLLVIQAHVIEKNMVLLEEIPKIFEPVKVIINQFGSKRKDYNHYTEKLKKLEAEKQAAEISGASKYSKEDLQKLLRVRPD